MSGCRKVIQLRVRRKILSIMSCMRRRRNKIMSTSSISSSWTMIWTCWRRKMISWEKRWRVPHYRVVGLLGLMALCWPEVRRSCLRSIMLSNNKTYIFWNTKRLSSSNLMLRGKNLTKLLKVSTNMSLSWRETSSSWRKETTSYRLKCKWQETRKKRWDYSCNRQ